MAQQVGIDKRYQKNFLNLAVNLNSPGSAEKNLLPPQEKVGMSGKMSLIRLQTLLGIEQYSSRQTLNAAERTKAPV